MNQLSKMSEFEYSKYMQVRRIEENLFNKIDELHSIPKPKTREELEPYLKNEAELNRRIDTLQGLYTRVCL